MPFKYRYALLGLLAAFTTSVMAAEGYRDMKFGAPQAKVLAQANCTIGEPEEAPVGTMYACEDFNFAGKQTEAVFFFVKEKFIRIAIALPDEDVVKTIATLKTKYGLAAHSTQKEMESVDLSPNKTAYINFDNNHISLVLTSDEEGDTSATLIYNSEDMLAMQKSRSSVSGDDL
ncbi:hypothetical protein [Phytobacter sp. V91]|uniref:hypothetical protein n=1 Tax=Phytobacter sp. V91 TaxID=3369425 RepID=UPI003F6260BA